MDITEKTQEDLSIEESQRKDEDRRIKSTIDIAAGYVAAESARVSMQKAAQKFAKPDKYTGNRNLYDSGAAKRNAKMELFKNGAEVFDPYTGDRLVLTKKEAKLLYGEEWTKHLAETDHIKPLEKIYEETKNNPWLSTENVKSIGNDSKNTKVVSRKNNNAKRSMTNKEFVDAREYRAKTGNDFTKEQEKRILKDGRQAEIYTRSSEAGMTVKNMVQTGCEAGLDGAKNAGITALTMSGIMNTVAVFRGEKDAEEAISDTIETGGKAAVTAFVMDDGLVTISHSLSAFSSKLSQLLAKTNVPGKVMTAIMTFGDTLKQYGNGEISTQQCLIELGEKGLGLATVGYSAMVGQALIPIPIVGSAVGALLGSLMTSGLYHGLINALQADDLEHQERLRIIAECREAAEQARAFRAELESYLENYFKEYRDCFDEALSEMNFAFQIGDSEGVIAGANQITRKLGGQIHYETIDQFKNFLNDNSIDVL